MQSLTWFSRQVTTSSHALSQFLFAIGLYKLDSDYFLCPEDQLIKTDQMNILIRSLMLKKQKAESGSKDGKSVPTSESSRKRYQFHILLHKSITGNILVILYMYAFTFHAICEWCFTSEFLEVLLFCCSG